VIKYDKQALALTQPSVITFSNGEYIATAFIPHMNPQVMKTHPLRHDAFIPISSPVMAQQII
jgi:hypothetical protein